MNNPNPQLNLNIKDAVDVDCDACKGTEFSPIFLIKRISALVSPTGKDVIIPIQVFKCDKCNHVNELFLDGLTN
tara:strand:- start:790 stop:1011 length:222 start_codon:yes stop_codon:yes gene_type:complete